MNLESRLSDFSSELHGYAAHTQAAYLRDLGKFAAYCQNLGLSDWKQVDNQHVRDFIASLHGQGISARSLQRLLSALRRFFKFLQLDGSVADNPARPIHAPKARRNLPHVMDPDQCARLVEVTPDKPICARDRALLELLYSSGLRVSEVVGLKVTDLELTACAVRVMGKGSKQRVVPVGSHACAALSNWLSQRARLAPVQEQALFVSRTGRALTPRAVQQRCARWGILQGIDRHVHPHMLRHSFASHVLESSGDLRAVQELLGHADIRTTQVYTHLDFQHLACVYDSTHPRARRRQK